MNHEYGAANQRIIAALASSNSADPGAHHVFDDGPELGWQLAAADVAMVDISAMVYDRLAAGKPLLVTRPVDPEAAVDTYGYLQACEWLDAASAASIVGEVARVLGDEAATARLTHWVTHYFGDTSPGAATAKFHAAIERLMARVGGVARPRPRGRRRRGRPRTDEAEFDDSEPGLSPGR